VQAHSRFVISLLLATLLAAAPAPAAAGQRKRGAPAATSASAQDEARELYKKGMTHYELGAFDEAIVEFKRAYELTSAPGLLFNIAQVYRMKKDAEQAVYFYRTYLRLMPAAPNRADVEALIAENQAIVDAQKAKRAEAETAAAASAAAGAPPAPAPAVTTTTTTTTTAPPPASRRPWRVELWSGVGVAALGVGALGAGIGLGLRASSDSSQISRANAQGDVPWDADKQRIYRDGQNSATASTVTYVVGGVLAATGAALVAVGLRDRARVRALAVAPAARGVTVGMTCAF
jgi:tetratricopeptide (TPR) repeat protein